MKDAYTRLVQMREERRISDKRRLAIQLIEEMADGEFEPWFDEREAEMSELATRRIGDG